MTLEKNSKWKFKNSVLISNIFSKNIYKDSGIFMKFDVA